ncbi:MAG: anaerobic ribonucleoside-triphosphate reductase activating protein [Paludibacteraceae bacterium]|nr:anaerobic ribonucleoside-triphosphate reductase activating protein [Paludibacteraceae bacterium]
MKGKIIQIDTMHENTRSACTSNGTGIRVIVWFSGCDIHCEGCHNEQYQNPESGEEFNENHLKKICDEISSYDYYNGISILGGEPFSKYNIGSCIELVKAFKEQFPSKDVWIWSGYTYEKLMEREDAKQLISMCDYLVDGPFILNKRNITLKFRGSDNQRIIDINKSLAHGIAVTMV